MTQKSARYTVVHALIQVNQNSGYSNVVLNQALQQSELSTADRMFASALFYGTLERKITLDFIISHYSSKPLNKLSPQVLEILRVSIYQILYLDSVPDSAAVNEGVALTKLLGVTSASGFVNAILRSFLRDDKKFPECKGNRLRKWEIRYSCPEWLIKILLETYGEEDTVSFLESSLGRQSLYARVNTTKITAHALIEKLNQEGIAAVECPDLKNCISLSKTSAVEDIPSFKEGLFHIQDKSSQLCASLLDAKPGESVLDLCAAPGSKSFTIAELMFGNGTITSCDLTQEKLSKVSEGAKRLGLSIIKPTLNDARIFNKSFPLFDCVLCDVPCSGIGIIGRKPEIKYKNPKELTGLPAIQKQILEQASLYLKPGGRMIYSTCTLLPQENTQITDSFLQKHNDFLPEPLPEELQKFLFGNYDQSRYNLTLFPNMVKTDGFFLAIMKKVR